MPSSPTPRERLAEIRERMPRVVELAAPLALAARLEPELVREVRLTLFPPSHPSLEAELYFSPLVAQRSPQWLVLDTALAHELQAGLASTMKREQTARAAMRRVRRLIARAHRSVPAEIALEEQIIWLAVARPHGRSRARRAIHRRLRAALAELLGEGERASAVARWFSSAVRRVPPLAREAPAFDLLVFAAGSLLGGHAIDPRVAPPLEAFEELAAYIPRSAARVRLWAALTTGGLHVVAEETPRYELLELPLTTPVLLEVGEEGAASRVVSMQPRGSLFVPLPGRSVRVRTLGRDLLTFRPRPAEAAGRRAVDSISAPALYRVFLSGPGDVAEERRLARIALEALSRTPPLRDRVAIQIVTWDELGAPTPILENVSPQEAVNRSLPKPSECDLTVLVLWSRMGTPVAAFKKPDDSPYQSRTEWEFDDARRAAKPILLYRRTAPPPVPGGTSDLEQARRVAEFFANLRRPADGALMGGYTSYSTPEEFALRLEQDVTSFVARWLSDPARPTRPQSEAVPELPRTYMPRPDLVHRLHQAVLDSPRVGIVGPPGFGKTVLAAAYARSAEVRQTFPGGIVWQSGRLDPLPPDRRSQRPRLYVVDELDQPRDVEPFARRLPNESRFLFTTRDRHVVEELGARRYEMPPLSEEEAWTLLAHSSGWSRESLPEIARLLIARSAGHPLYLALAGAAVRDGHRRWEDLAADAARSVRLVPATVHIVVARAQPDAAILNVACVLHNDSSRAVRVERIEARLVEPRGSSLTLAWTVFYNTGDDVHRRAGDAGPFDAPPGETRIGIQFASAGPRTWSAGRYQLDLQGRVAGTEADERPSFVATRTIVLSSRDVAQIERWRHASAADWARLDDEAIGIPVQLTAEGTHPWPFRIAADRFIPLYSEARPVPEYGVRRRLTDGERAGLRDLIERLNADEQVTNIRIAAYVLATVAADTNRAFHPVEGPPSEGSERRLRELGNIEPKDKERYRGRGYILLEGRANYRRLSEEIFDGRDLERDPESLLDPAVAYEALRLHMLRGRFTGRRLAQFLDVERADYLGAYREVYAPRVESEELAREAALIEALLRECLVPRDVEEPGAAPASELSV